MLVPELSLLDAGGGAVGVAVLPASLAEPVEAWLAPDAGAGATAFGVGALVAAAAGAVDVAAALGLAVLVDEVGQALVAVSIVAVLVAFRGNGDVARRAAMRVTVSA